MSKELNRESFVFYNSFFEAIDVCPVENQRNIYRAIAVYALRGVEEPNLKGVEKAVFLMAKPQIDANTKRYLNGFEGKKHGAKGGAPKGNKNASKKKECEEPQEPELKERLSGADFFSNGVTNLERLKSFAISQGFTEHDAENFCEYNMFNAPAGSNRSNLYDKNGDVIENVFGAFLNFVTSGYNREEWLKENGMEKGQNNPKTTPKQPLM